ncbi:MAG: gamma carbonic anhydrase family protein [Streptosporangiales bacterium]
MLSEDEPSMGTLGGHRPAVDPKAWVAPGAVLVGRVHLGPGASVWYGCVLRAEDDDIVLGADVNVQDLSCLHAEAGEPAILEDRVSVGHRAIVHGARIGAGSLIGMGAVVLGSANVGEGALIAAGAVVRPGSTVPPGTLAAGVPAKVLRPLKDEERSLLDHTWRSYIERREQHRTVTW